ncbi:hypothetical protein NDU88_000142 [Pleurodeles waltl]|uniref:Uncharacterized protein n=1 Tax=Pleurodeles waltl TaxID=8319 RepID=A0AAV7KUU1_PLEWA|nr:hypothetical protein NDU88_000142 [Pleurodeles waltl]
MWTGGAKKRTAAVSADLTIPSHLSFMRQETRKPADCTSARELVPTDQVLSRCPQITYRAGAHRSRTEPVPTDHVQSRCPQITYRAGAHRSRTEPVPTAHLQSRSCT